MSALSWIFVGLFTVCLYHDAASFIDDWYNCYTALGNKCGNDTDCQEFQDWNYLCLCTIDKRPTGPYNSCDPNRAKYVITSRHKFEYEIPVEVYERRFIGYKDGTIEKESMKKESIELGDSLRCLRNQFKCADGKKCVSVYLRCDTNKGCDDWSDEVSCNAHRCRKGYHRCTTGQCIPELFVCDGVPDCSDLSDEKDCAPPVVDSECLENQFQCSDAYGSLLKRCIPAFNRCDNSSDCFDASDESGCDAYRCPHGYIRCGSSRKCLPDMFVCDGVKNCHDGSDEKDCGLCGNDRRHKNLRKKACGVPQYPSWGYPFFGTFSKITESTIALGYPSNDSEWYPRNIRELEEYCSVIHSFAPCLINMEFKCNGASKRILGSALDACAEGTAFQKGIQENIECIYESLLNHRDEKTPCRSNRKDINGKYMRFVLTGGLTTRNFEKISVKQRQVIDSILGTFSELDCFLSHLECPSAEDVLLEVFARVSDMRQNLYELKNVTFEIMSRLDFTDEQIIGIKRGMHKYENACEKINCAEYENKLMDLYY